LLQSSKAAFAQARPSRRYEISLCRRTRENGNKSAGTAFAAEAVTVKE
jgi:hypothetical protein